MPHKNFLKYPKWVEDLDDECLKTGVIEALVARQSAIVHGALENRACKAVFSAAEATLDKIRDGSVTGEVAWKKADDALQKYTTARECAAPTATRSAKRGRR